MCTVLNGKRVKLLIKSGTGSYFSGKVEKLWAFVEEGPGAKLSLAYMHGKSNSSAVILPQWAKKEGSTSACYLWRFTEVWEMLMWLTFIYNVFRNGPRVHVLPLRLSYCTCWGKKGVIQNLLCSARAHNADFFFFWDFSVTLVENFSPPSIPSLVSKYLSLCASVPRWRRGKPSGAFVLPECLSWKCELFHGLAEHRFI